LLGFQNFKASGGWLSNFKKSHNFSQHSRKIEISTKQISSIRSVGSNIFLYKSSLARQHSIGEYVNFDV